MAPLIIIISIIIIIIIIIIILDIMNLVFKVYYTRLFTPVKKI